MAHVHVDRARLAVVGAPADPLEQLAPREDDARLGGEQREQLELDERQLHGLAPYLDRPPWEIDHDVAAVDQLVAATGQVGRRRTPEKRADATSELADRERLRDVVVRAELETEDLVELVVAGGQHDDRDGALRAQAPADLEPVHSRQHDVEDDEVDVLLAKAAERLVPIPRLDDAVPIPLEWIREQGLDGVLVVHEEDGRGGIRHAFGAATPRRDRLLAPTIAPCMEPARLATASRRPRRGSVERPIDTRLVRKVALVLVAPLLLAVLTLNRSGPLPPPALPPSFDADTAVSLTTELASVHPDRVPGSLEAGRAADWVRAKLALYGLAARDDTWEEDVPGVGRVELRNLVAVVEGTLDEAIVVVAHRDNNGRSAGANDNASGTAALIELARPYALAGTTESARTPLHTLVFLSTDGGAYGSLGVARFAERSPLADRAVAVVSLDGLAGSATTRLELAGLDGRSPPPVLVRTADARISAETGAAPVRPGVLTQLVSLALPFGYGEQAPVLGAGEPALRITTGSDAGTPSGSDELEGLRPARLGQLGRASEALLNSLDSAVELPDSTDGALFLGDRVVRGWALQLLLLASVVPFGAATLDLLSRCRLRRLPLAAAWRALRRRVGVWLVLVLLLGLAAVVGALPDDPSLPPPPDQPPVDSWPFGVLAVLAIVAGLVWLRARARLVPRVRATPEEELAAYAVGYVALLLVCAGTALVSPYGLVLVVPSLYAWLLLPQLRRSPGWLTDVVFGIGLLGPVLSLVVLAEQLGLGVRAPLYAAALVTTGVVPWASTILFAAWGAIASLVGAIAAGRYAPVSRER